MQVHYAPKHTYLKLNNRNIVTSIFNFDKSYNYTFLLSIELFENTLKHKHYHISRKEGKKYNFQPFYPKTLKLH